MLPSSLSGLYFESVRASKGPIIWFAGAVLVHVGLCSLPIRNSTPSRQGIVFIQGNGGIEVDLLEESVPVAVEQSVVPPTEISPVTNIALEEPSLMPAEDSSARKSEAPVLTVAHPHHAQAKRETTGTSTRSRRAGTTAAQPASQVFTTQPPYPPAALELGVEGAVRLQVRVGVDGCPRNVKVVRSSGRSDFDLSSVRTVQREWRFRPARTSDGAAVESTVVVKVTFDLNDHKS